MKSYKQSIFIILRFIISIIVHIRAELIKLKNTTAYKYNA
jgi:hypothetical protein